MKKCMIPIDLIPRSLSFAYNVEQWTSFLRRLEMCRNTKALEYFREWNPENGIRCSMCNKIKPVPEFGQNKECKYGIRINKCLVCERLSRKNGIKRFVDKATNPVPLTVPFEEYLWLHYKERMKNNCNSKALELCYRWNTLMGICCVSCEESRPLYNYCQSLKSRHGLNLTYCTDCIVVNQDPFATLMANVKSCTRQRGHYPPEFDTAYLKELYKRQNKLCAYSGIKMSLKPGSFKVSVERLDNSIHYTKQNIVLICVFLQFGYSYNIQREATRSLIYYNPELDDYKFDFETEKKLLNTTRKTFIKNSCRGAKISTEARHLIKKRKFSGIDDDNLESIVITKILDQNCRCAYTHIPFVFTRRSLYRPSIDRIDNTLGYTFDNIQIIITPLNTPWKPTLEEFQQIRSEHFEREASAQEVINVF